MPNSSSDRIVVQAQMSGQCAAQPVTAMQVKMTVNGRTFQRDLNFRDDPVRFADVVGALMRASVEAVDTIINPQGSK